jgi:hypothetical protein
VAVAGLTAEVVVDSTAAVAAAAHLAVGASPAAGPPAGVLAADRLVQRAQAGQRGQVETHLQAAANRAHARILRSEQAVMAPRIRSAVEAAFLRRTRDQHLLDSGGRELPAHLAQLRMAVGTRSGAAGTAPLPRKFAMSRALPADGIPLVAEAARPREEALRRHERRRAQPGPRRLAARIRLRLRRRIARPPTLQILALEIPPLAIHAWA